MHAGIYVHLYLPDVVFCCQAITIGIHEKERNMSTKKLKSFSISSITLAISIRIVVSWVVVLLFSVMHIVEVLLHDI